MFTYVQYFNIQAFLSFIYFDIFNSFSFKFSQSLCALLVNLIQICIHLCILFLIKFLTYFSLNFSPDPSLKTPAIKDRFNVHWDLFYIISLF